MKKSEFDRRMAAIMAQEQALGVKIEILDLHDEDHLDCVWYGGKCAEITYPDGWKVLIEANGDIRLYGNAEGIGSLEVTDKNNGGRVFRELGHRLDDDDITRLEGSDDPSNYLVFGNNNWFELNVVSPSGRFIDMCDADNILDGNLLDCLEGVGDYLVYVEWAKEAA